MRKDSDGVFLMFLILLIVFFNTWSSDSLTIVFFAIAVGYLLYVVFRVSKYNNSTNIEIDKIGDKKEVKEAIEHTSGIKEYSLNPLLDTIKSVYPDFDVVAFTSMIKLNFDKLTNKSISLDKSLKMISTNNFIEKYSDKMEFIKNIDSDTVSKTSNIKIIDFNVETKQLLIRWKYSMKIYEYNPKTGKIIRGLTRVMDGERCFWIIRSDNIKFKDDVVHCPNCGAPLKYAHDLKCNHCMSSFDYDNYWLINELV